MKKRFLSALAALAMTVSAFGAVAPITSAAPLQGEEYIVDFSQWETGEYSLEQLADAASADGMSVADYNTGNSSMKYAVVYDEELGKNVLELDNQAASGDGFVLQLDKPLAGKNATYRVKSMTKSTGASYGINNKYVANKDGKMIISGMLLGTRVQLHSGGWIYPENVAPSTWLDETMVIDTTGKTYMYITDKSGRISNNGSYDLVQRYTGNVVSASVYAEKIVKSYVSEIGFRTYPTVIDSGVYGGDEKYADISAVSTSKTTVKAVFDHNMDKSTIISDNILLYNANSGEITQIPDENISYDEQSFTVTVKAGRLAAGTDYEIRFTAGIANTDNIALKPFAAAFTTGADAFEQVSFKILDKNGYDLGTENVITDKAEAAVLEMNNKIASASVTINSDNAEYTKSDDGKALIIPVSLTDGETYTVTVSGLTDTSGNTFDDLTLAFNTREASVDYFCDDFEHITAEYGEKVSLDALLPQDTAVSIALPQSTSPDGIFEVVEKDGGKAIKMSQPEGNKIAYGIKLNFEKDLFALLGNENVVAEMDYYVDNTSASSYAAFARMNNTASLYVQNNALSQQTIGELKNGLNGKNVHYKWALNSNGTMNVYANGEHLSYNGSYDIAFRSKNNKPNTWEIYLNGGVATYYIMDNLRIRNYPMADLSFKTSKEIVYSSENVIPGVEEIYVTFDNTMNADSVNRESISLVDENGTQIACKKGAYNTASHTVALVPKTELEMGRTYSVVLDSGIVNSQNKALGENVLTFTTLNVAPVGIEKISVADYNKLYVDFDAYIDTASLTAADISVGGAKADSVTVDRNPQNYAAHRAVVTIDGVLDAGEGTLVINGGADTYGRSLAGLDGGYVVEDKVYLSSVDFVLDGGDTEAKISIALPGGSAIDKLTVAAGYYIGENELGAAAVNNCGEVESGRVVQISAGALNITNAPDAAFVQVYVWSDTTTMKPLCDRIRVMKPITVHIVGDSKVSEYKEASYPQQGWGHFLGEMLIDSASVNNKAQSGTTTTTFRTGKIITDSENPDEIVYSDYRPWDKITEVLSSGDYVIIDLAHNDKYSSDSGANDIEAYKANIAEYVDEIRSYGAIPVLMSTVPHVRAVTNELADYGAAMKEVADEKGTIFLDVNAAAYSIFEQLGYEETKNTFYLSNAALKNVYNMTDEQIANAPNSSMKNNGYDYIHFSIEGARRVAKIVAQELAQCGDSIALYVK